MSGRVKQDVTLPCCLDSDFLKQVDLIAINLSRKYWNGILLSFTVLYLQTSDPGQYYPTSGYVLWDSSRNPSFKCRAFSWADSGETSPACRECHEEIRKCQI